jgi:alkylhydroperoxidase family enzyme
MARVPFVDPDTASQVVKNNLEANKLLFGGGGRPVNSVLMMSHTPHVAKFITLLVAALQREGAGSLLSGRIKTLVDLKTSAINDCAYSLDHAKALGSANRLDNEKLTDVISGDYMNSPHLTPREKAAVLWAEHVTRNTARDRQDVFDMVAKEFSPAEIVELTLVSAFRTFRNLFNDALLVDIDAKTFERGRASKVDPQGIKAYLEKLVADWPADMPVPRSD